jgi:Rad3-related DNA helicase
MAFKITKQENFSYASPQEMYQDNKLKKIMGLLDYQAAMLEKYIEKYDRKILAMELPTGSGKTLVGLLIGEFRRLKNKEKIVYLCPTNQLVNQVVSHANEKYGLKATAFCGKQKEYNPKDKSSYMLANTIAVTTYSSFFAQNSFFSNADIIIMDDVHSSEDYIISNWTLELKKGTLEFSQIVELLRDIIDDNDYHYLTSDDLSADNRAWTNIVPMPLLAPKLTNILNIIRTNLSDGNNYYSFSRIEENLEECNMYLSSTSIMIRPWIAPTLTIPAFKATKQKILRLLPKITTTHYFGIML